MIYALLSHFVVCLLFVYIINETNVGILYIFS